MDNDMAHYINAEQLKAELDKRYTEYRAKMKTDDFTYYEGMADALDLFEQYIDSLSEQPVEGLDVTDFCKPIDPGIAQCVADHWWEMIGEESTNKKSVEGLEEEIETYFKGWYMDETDQGYILHTPDDHAGLMSVKQVARHFAEWGAEHARKEDK